MNGAKRSSLKEGGLDRGELCFAFQYTWCWVIGFDVGQCLFVPCLCVCMYKGKAVDEEVLVCITYIHVYREYSLSYQRYI
jgi:hypothetical protein